MYQMVSIMVYGSMIQIMFQNKNFSVWDINHTDINAAITQGENKGSTLNYNDY